MSGTIALIALALALAGTASVFLIGYRAITRRPTAENLHPENAPRYVLSALLIMIAALVAWIIFLVAGVTWIVERFTT